MLKGNERKTLQQWCKIADATPLSEALNEELNMFLSTSGVSYPLGALSAYMLKKEILKGNLKAIRLEAKVKGEYEGDPEDEDEGETFLERHRREKDKKEEEESREALAKINEEIRQIRRALGENVGDEASERSLKQWLLFMDSHKAPEGLQEDINRVLATQGKEYTIDVLSLYILKKEILKGNLNAIRLESTIRGTIAGESDDREPVSTWEVFNKEEELQKWEEKYIETLKAEGSLSEEEAEKVLEEIEDRGWKGAGEIWQRLSKRREMRARRRKRNN